MAASAEWIAKHVQGLREAKAAFNALPRIVREQMLAATETTVREIARGAQARLESSPSIRTRALYNHVAWKVTPTNGRGRVGIATGTTTSVIAGVKVRVKGIQTAGGHVIQPTRYAHLVEHGTRHMPAEPFMLPATEAQKQPYLERCRAAGKGIEKNVAAIGQAHL
jgi:HK97 gp10 family phage protein